MWHAIFGMGIGVGEKLLRALIVYAFLIVALRVLGKRELAQQDTLDFLVLVLVANAVQNGIIGADNSVTGAIVGAVALARKGEAYDPMEHPATPARAAAPRPPRGGVQAA